MRMPPLIFADAAIFFGGAQPIFSLFYFSLLRCHCRC